jgi:mannose-6-phosphate isomerase-like protein (cupin superfamily)
MRTIAAVAFGLILGLTYSSFAQQGGAPRGGGQQQASITETAIVTAAEVSARTANGNLIRLTPYNINLEVRNEGRPASVHETEAEMFYVIEGAGTLVTGGKLVGETRTNAENLSGTSIQGGVTKRVSKGDWILVPAGQPHQYPAVEAGGLRLMALHLPKKVG